MKRVGAVLVGVTLLLGAAAGCSTKPSEEACEKAVSNIRKLTGQSNTEIGADKRAAIRSCRAQSSKDTVECMAEARTAEELFACGGKMAEQLKKAMEAQAKEPPGKDAPATGDGKAPPPPPASGDPPKGP